ncbi:MAG: hypothetical protein HQL58_02760 [Magnetococcales bacterium]|nr:hypothetical protein [Magnetococcales bacterium]
MGRCPDQSSLALKLRQQIVCLDFRWIDHQDGTDPLLSLQLQLTNDCFGVPKRLQHALVEALQTMGYHCRVAVLAAPSVPDSSHETIPSLQRPETLQETADRHQMDAQQHLEQRVRHHDAIRAVQQLFAAELVQCTPFHPERAGGRDP